MGRGGSLGGIGVGGIGMGGMGGGRSRRQSQTDPGVDSSSGSRGLAPTLTVRWESALPVQEAHLKLPDSNGPSIDEGYYTLAVFSIPYRLIGEDLRDLDKRLKSEGQLKREGRKTVRSSEAKVLEQDNGLLVLFKFPRSSEITKSDGAVEFAAHIGEVKVVQSFRLNEMVIADKLEL